MFGVNPFGAPYLAQGYQENAWVIAIATVTPTASHTSTRRNTHRHIAATLAIDVPAKATIGAD